MKLLVLLCAAPLALLAPVAAIPVLLANGDTTTALACAPAAVPIETVLATIRSIESGDNYQAANTASSASGAYQILDTSWAGYAGYRRAVDAPPDVQDAKAAEMVDAIVTDDHDVTAVPVVWYIGHLPEPGSNEWDTIPAPQAGNRLTPRQYQERWMTHYNEFFGTTPPTTLTSPAALAAGTSTPALPDGCIAGPPGEILPGGWALPGPRTLLAATANQLDNPHHDYPAWDWIVPTRTPIYAIRAGTVATISAWPHNWWEQGCTTSGVNGCATCGIGVTIVDDLGIRWTYCHGSSIHVSQGSTVTAGTLLIDSGNSGRSGTPHVHIEIRINGTQRCPQPLITSLYQTGRGLDPRALPDSGCTF